MVGMAELLEYRPFSRFREYTYIYLSLSTFILGEYLYEKK